VSGLVRLVRSPVRHPRLGSLGAREARTILKGFYRRRWWAYELFPSVALIVWMVGWMALMILFVRLVAQRFLPDWPFLVIAGVWYTWVFGGACVAAFAVYRIMLNRELDRAARENLCLHCGYCLEGLIGGEEGVICPECGRPREPGTMPGRA
jgi:hypothetical protein